MNNKEKVKLDMFSGIDVVLKRVSEYLSVSECSQRQLAQVKRELGQRNL